MDPAERGDAEEGGARHVAGIRQVGDHHVEAARAREEVPDIAHVDAHPGVAERPAVERREDRLAQAEHLGVAIDQVHLAHPGDAQDLAQREPVPAAEDEDPEVATRRPLAGERGRERRQRLVVAVLVAGVELKVAVEVEAEPLAASLQEDVAHRGLR